MSLSWRHYWMSDPSPLLLTRCCFPAANSPSERKTLQLKNLIQGLRLYSRAHCAQSRLEASITSGVLDLNPKETPPGFSIAQQQQRATVLPGFIWGQTSLQMWALKLRLPPVHAVLSDQGKWLPFSDPSPSTEVLKFTSKFKWRLTPAAHSRSPFPDFHAEDLFCGW